MPSGFPVVVSPFGMPFVHSENAPHATLATNGFGMPVQIVSRNAPPLNFLASGPVSEAPLDFTITAGSSGEFTGYYTTITGSVDQQPIDGNPLEALITRGYVNFGFQGNCLHKVLGWTIQIEGFNLGNIESDWQYNSSTDSTECLFDGMDMFTVGEQYNVTWIQS